MKKLSGILWGTVFVVLGVLLVLNALQIISFTLFFKGWWTLFIIVPCAIGLVTDKDKTGSIIGICLGVFLLLCSRDILEYDMLWKMLLPIVVIIIGLRMIFGNIFGRRHNDAYKAVTNGSADVRHGTAAFAGIDITPDGEVFEGAELNAVFGGVKCDIRRAIIEKDCVIKASAVFGGIDILVPDTVNIQISSNSLFGGVSDERKFTANIPDAPTLYINASCMFGGIDVK